MYFSSNHSLGGDKGKKNSPFSRSDLYFVLFFEREGVKDINFKVIFACGGCKYKSKVCEDYIFHNN